MTTRFSPFDRKKLSIGVTVRLLASNYSATKQRSVLWIEIPGGGAGARLMAGYKIGSVVTFDSVAYVITSLLEISDGNEEHLNPGCQCVTFEALPLSTVAAAVGGAPKLAPPTPVANILSQPQFQAKGRKLIL